MKLRILLPAMAMALFTGALALADTEPDNNTTAGADAITENVAVEGDIGKSAADPNDYYVLYTTGDGALNISATLTGGSGYFYLKMYDIDGTTQLGTAQNNTGTTISFNVNNRAAGQYYIRIYPNGSSDSCHYTLTATLTPAAYDNDAEPDDSPGTAQPMTENSSVTGHIGYQYNGGSYDQNDYYVFTTSHDGNITLNYSNLVGAYNVIYLYDIDGTTELASAAGYGSAILNAGGLAAGTYYVKVNFYNSGFFSGYTLTNTVTPAAYSNDTEPNGDEGSALPLAENVSVNGHIGYRWNGGAYDQDDYYVLSTSNDGNIKLILKDTTSVYLRIYLYDGAILLGESEATGGPTLQVNGLAAGTYYARINYYGVGHFTGYTLTDSVLTDGVTNDTEPNNTPATALSMAENTTVHGHIGYQLNGGTYDVDDYYKFTTTSDGRISLAFSNVEGAYNRVYLYDSNGTTQLNELENYGSFTMNTDGLAAGTYYARVNYYSHTYFSGYTLTNSVTPAAYVNDAEPDDNEASALPLSENASVSGHIGYRWNGGTYDQDDYYVFTTTQDGKIKLILSDTTGVYLRVYLYDSLTQLGEAEATGGATVIVSNLAAGTYFARVNFYGIGKYAGYVLTDSVLTDGIPNDVESNDTYETADSLSENGSVQGHIGYRLPGGLYDQNDFYVFHSSSDGKIKLALSNVEGAYNRIYLYDSNGTTQLAEAEGYGYAELNYNGLAAGKYFALVNYFSYASFSGYTLTDSIFPADYANDAENNDSFDSARAMLSNTTVYGHIGYRRNGGDFDQNDNYNLILHSSGSLNLNLTNTNGSYFRLYLYNSTFAQIGENEAYGTCSISQPALAAGTYYVTVNFYSTSSFSSYALQNSFCPDTVIIEALGETTFCDGESVTLSTDDHHLSYLWNDGSVTEENVVTLTGDNYLTIDDGEGCVRTSNTISTETTPLPVAVISPDGPTTFCDGGSVTLSVPAGPDSYLWSTGETTPTITVSTTGDYSVQLFKNSCTAISDPVHITVNPNPVATITPGGSTTICEGSTVTLTASAGASYLWSTGETTNTIDAGSTDDYSVTVTNAEGCSTTSDPLSVTVNPLPEVSISAGGPTEFCDGGSVTLSPDGSHTSYLWSNGETTETIDAATSGTYNLMVTDLGCSATSNNIDVTVDANPVATITPDGPTTFCVGGSVDLTAGGGDTYLWSDGETTETITVTSTGDYSVTAYSTAGCNNTSSITSVTVNDCGGELTISADGPTTFCDGGSVTLTSSIADGNLWNTGETTTSITVSATGDYYCMNGVNTSNTISVTVNPNPEATITPDGPTSFCDGGSVNLNASSGDSYLWSDGETTAGINVTTSGNYSVTVSSAEGCSTSSDAVTVTVNPIPEISISADGPTTFCDGGSVNLNPDGTHDSYLWSDGETSESIYISSSGTFNLSVTDQGCSATSNDITVTVNPNPEPSILADGATEFCEGGSVGLSTDMAYDSYLWNTGSTDPSITASTTGSYSVTVTLAGCTGSAADVDVTADTQPTISISADGDRVCYGSTLEIDADASLGDLQWYDQDGAIGGETGTSYFAGSQGNYYCTATNGACVVSSNTVSLRMTKPTDVTPAGPLTLCPGSTVDLNVPLVPGATYQWYHGNDMMIPGATDATYTASTNGKYYCVITKAGCARRSRNVIINTGCRDAESLVSDIDLFPNPAMYAFTLSWTAREAGSVQIELTDMTGKRVWTDIRMADAGINTATYTSETLASGVYMILIIDSSGNVSQKKLVIEK